MTSRNIFWHFFLANFFMFVLLISNHTVFLVQFEINLYLLVFQKAEIALAEAARAISAFWKTHSCKIYSTLNSKPYDYYPGCQRFFLHGFRCRSCLFHPPREKNLWVPRVLSQWLLVDIRTSSMFIWCVLSCSGTVDWKIGIRPPPLPPRKKVFELCQLSFKFNRI